jgi:hypothetical protein
MIGLKESSDLEALGTEEPSETMVSGVTHSSSDLGVSAAASQTESERETRSSDARVDAVWRAVWPHLCCYLLPIDDYTRWFLMDEVC